MPTGYTEKIKDGIAFKEFVLGCAKAFGACIDLRDAPANEPIPVYFKPSDFYSQQVVRISRDIDFLDILPDLACQQMINNKFGTEVENYYKVLKEVRDLRLKYEQMLKNVNEWVPPTKDHENLKEFMLTQLNDSLKCDCNEDYLKFPIKLSLKEWQETRRATLMSQLSTAIEDNEEEVKRTNERNKWITDLRESLEE